MIGLVLAANIIASAVFFIKNREDKGAVLMLLIFLAAPVFGILIYYIPIWMFTAFHKRNVYNNIYNVEDLIYSGKSENYVKRPDMDKEMNVVPVKEALIINDAVQKRKIILDIIKTDMNKNYKTILPALKDSDSETSHYAASMAMEIQSRQRKVIQELEKKLASGEPAEIQLLEAYKSYADNGILTGKDIADIKQRYIKLITTKEDQINDHALYVTLADYLAEEKQYEKAIAALKKRLEAGPEERLYNKLLEIYYLTGRKEEFKNTIHEIRNSEIVLSPEGLEKLRFWIRKGD